MRPGPNHDGGMVVLLKLGRRHIDEELIHLRKTVPCTPPVTALPAQGPVGPRDSLSTEAERFCASNHRVGTRGTQPAEG